MTTTTLLGPYYLHEPEGIPPRGASNWHFENDIFQSGKTFTVSGIPNTNYSRNEEYLLWVSDMSVSVVNTGHGGIANYHVSLYATFFNPSYTTVVKDWEVYISVVSE